MSKQQLEIGKGVKWTAVDEDGATFSHIGKVSNLTDKFVEFTTKHGRMTIRLTDGTFEVVQVTDASLDTSDVSEPLPAPPRKAATGAREGSKLERAIALVKANPDATSADLKKMFIEQLSMTALGAQTYVYNAKKKVAEEAAETAVKKK